MKKVLLTLLAVIVIVGALAGAGFWGYRMSYANSATGSDGGPFFGRPYHMDPSQMPFHRFEGRGFERGFGFNQHPMMQSGGYYGYGMRYGFFSSFHLLWNVALLALVIWFVYWLFTKSGWQITRKMDAVQKSDSNDPPGN